MSFRPVYSMLVAFAAVLLTGCGANPYGYDPYGYGGAYGDPYGSSYGGASSYGSDYGSSYGGSSSYGSDYGSSYGGSSSYGSDYGSSYGTGSTYGSGGTYGGGTYGSGGAYGSGQAGTYGGSYGENGSAYGDDAVVQGPQGAKRPTATPPVAPQAPSLSAWVVDVKEPSLLGKLTGGKIVAKVEVENPTDRTLTGKLRVRFLDNGDPTGVIQTRKVTLRPKEKQVFTFSAEAMRLDDAEATVETDAPATGGGTVSDRG